jgi:hypothetical protein
LEQAMTTYFLEPRSQLLDAAKEAALDAVAGYESLNRYTIGVAVQAAAAVLRTDVHPNASRLREDVWDCPSVEVTPRLRALEIVAEAARRSHASGGVHGADEECLLCGALQRLEEAG